MTLRPENEVLRKWGRSSDGRASVAWAVMADRRLPEAPLVRSSNKPPLAPKESPKVNMSQLNIPQDGFKLSAYEIRKQYAKNIGKPTLNVNALAAKTGATAEEKREMKRVLSLPLVKKPPQVNVAAANKTREAKNNAVKDVQKPTDKSNKSSSVPAKMADLTKEKDANSRPQTRATAQALQSPEEATVSKSVEQNDPGAETGDNPGKKSSGTTNLPNDKVLTNSSAAPATTQPMATSAGTANATLPAAKTIAADRDASLALSHSNDEPMSRGEMEWNAPQDNEENSTGWIKPGRRGRRRGRPQQSSDGFNRLPTNNKFGSLRNDDNENEMTADPRDQQQQQHSDERSTDGSTDRQSLTNVNKGKNKQFQRKKTENFVLNSKIPPFCIHDQNVKTVSNIVTQIVPDKKKFIFKKVKNRKTLLLVADLETYNNVKNALWQNDVHCVTRSPNEERVISLLIKGINEEFEVKDVQDELLSHQLGGVKFLSIEKIDMKERFQTKTGGICFLVQVTGDSKLASLFRLNRLLNQIVTWETVKRRDGVQCWRCLRIGHIKKNCNLPYRCMLCLDDHLPGECPVAAVERSQRVVSCVHCRQTGHPGTYRGCPKLKEIKKRIDQNLEKIRQSRIKKTTTTASNNNNNRTYADVTNGDRGNTHNAPHPPPFNGAAPQAGFQQPPPTFSLDDIEKSFEASLSKNLANIKSDLINTLAQHLEPIKRQVEQNTENIYVLHQMIVNQQDKPSHG